MPHVLNLDGIVFTRPGQYNFDVTVDGQHHVSIPLTVVDMRGAFDSVGRRARERDPSGHPWKGHNALRGYCLKSTDPKI